MKLANKNNNRFNNSTVYWTSVWDTLFHDGFIYFAFSNV